MYLQENIRYDQSTKTSRKSVAALVRPRDPGIEATRLGRLVTTATTVSAGAVNHHNTRLLDLIQQWQRHFHNHETGPVQLNNKGLPTKKTTLLDDDGDDFDDLLDRDM